MTKEELFEWQYPIGKFERQAFSESIKAQWLLDIQYLPQHLENAVLNLDEAQLNTPYREGGWTVQQLVHHLADSHMNAYTRCKLCLTEDNPTIKPYDEVKWSELPDVLDLPIHISITLLHALHRRWHYFLQELTAADWDRTVFHPVNNRSMSLWDLLGIYAWHSRHHVAHILHLRESKKW